MGAMIIFLVLGVGLILGGLKSLDGWGKIRSGKIVTADIIDWIKIKNVNQTFSYVPKIEFVNPGSEDKVSLVLKKDSFLFVPNSEHYSKIRILITTDGVSKFSIFEMVMMVTTPIILLMSGVAIIIGTVRYLN